MHVLIVHQMALPAGAIGITRHGDLSVELARRGHTVAIIASRFHYLTRGSAHSQADRGSSPGVEFKWLDTGGYTRNDGRRIASMVLFGARAFTSALTSRPRPDVIIGSSPQPLAALAASVAARVLRVPFVLEVRDVWPSVLVDLGAIRRGGVSHRALEWVERYLYRHATRVIVVPPEAGRRLEEVGEDATKCIHIPNAASAVLSSDEAMPESLQEILDAATGRSVVMYLGAHGVSNDLRTVLAAADRIRSLDPDAYEQMAFVLIGDGSEKWALEEFAHAHSLERVTFHPPIRKGAVGAALRRSHLLLVSFADAPTYGYGLSPNKLFDYMAVGRPILMASRSATTVLNRHEAGYTYQPGNPEDLASKILEVLGLPDESRDALGQHGRDAVVEHYSVEVTGRQLEQLLLGIVPGLSSDRNRSG